MVLVYLSLDGSSVLLFDRLIVLLFGGPIILPFWQADCTPLWVGPVYSPLVVTEWAQCVLFFGWAQCIAFW